MKSSNLLGRVFRTFFLCALVGMLSGLANANNVRILGKPKLIQDTAEHHAVIKFDIAWDNSWKSTKPDNNDAVWIFVKCWDGETWNHVYLKDTVANIAGSVDPKDAACYGDKSLYQEYYVSNRDASNTKMAMQLIPGFSLAYPQWHLDPDEEKEQCVVGFFLQRINHGAGHVVVPGIDLIWDYARQGFVDEDDLVVKVFAVEMVYVPEGAYYLGGKGLTDANRHYGSFTTNAATFGTPMIVSSEKAITVANTVADTTLWTAGGVGIVAGTIPDGFPKGYQAFYIMKYEMTQEAYVEFLNTLSQGQQDGRVTGTLSTFAVNAWYTAGIDGNGYGLYRNVIRVKQAAPQVIFGCDGNNNTKYDETNKIKYDGRDSLVRNIDGQDLAMNFVNVLDLLAYAEFSGLRPMTELEYEKACRGPKEPANDEFAWGSVTMTFYAGRQNGYLDIWTGTERANGVYNSGANVGSGGNWWGGCWWTTATCAAPMRVGCFADSTTTRAASGATFWGVMNMSDNVGEICISAFDVAGRNFVGSHGSGQLDGNGDAINTDWLTFGGVTSVAANCRYFLVRGMMFSNNIYYGATIPSHEWQWAGLVSNRRTSTHTLALNERNYVSQQGTVGMRGIRCVRTAGAAK